MRFDEEKANKAIRKLESLKLSKGQWANQPVELLPYQVEITRALIGTLNDNDDFRFYKEAFIFLPARNGKTTYSALLSLLFLTDKTEPGGECYSAAPTRLQASIIYETMKSAILQNEYLSSFLKCNDSKKRIANLDTGSIYQALSSEVESVEGFDASFIIVDELHAHKSPDLYHALTYRMGSRRQPLLLNITTAGQEPSKDSICYQLYERAKRVEAGLPGDERFYVKLFEAKPNDNIYDPEVWYRTNPGLGTIKNIQDVEKSAQAAKQNSWAEAYFRRYVLNQWVAGESRWLNLDQWAKASSKEPTGNLVAYIGVDIAATNDLTCVCLLLVDPATKNLWVEPFFFVPEEQIKERAENDDPIYATWKEKGQLIATSGESTDYEAIQNKIVELCKQRNVRKIGIDKWNANQLLQDLDKMDLPAVDVRQGFSLSPALKEIVRFLAMGKLKHGNNEVLNWNVSNAKVKAKDEGQSIRLVKDSQKQKIDGVAAMATAIAAFMSDSLTDIEEKSDDELKMIWL